MENYMYYKISDALSAFKLSLVSLVVLGVAATQGAPQISIFRQTQYQNVLSSGNSDGNDGRYIPDNSGAYYPDQSGSYQHDNSGDYVPDDNPYVHQAGNAGSDYSGSGGVGGSGGFGSSSGSLGGGSTIVVGTGLGGPYTGKLSGLGIYANKVSGISAAGGYGQPSSLKQGNAAGLYDNKNYAIIRKIENVEPESYNYLYETENGIYAEEQGQLANKGSENEGIQAKGYFTYTGPDNVVYTVQYTADENGFVPQGAHLPTPPPIPEAILRSLEYQKSLGEL